VAKQTSACSPSAAAATSYHARSGTLRIELRTALSASTMRTVFSRISEHSSVSYVFILWPLCLGGRSLPINDERLARGVPARETWLSGLFLGPFEE